MTESDGVGISPIVGSTRRNRFAAVPASPTAGRPRLAADLNALVLYALLLGMLSIFIIGGLTARPGSHEPTDSAWTPAMQTSRRGS